MYVILYNLVSHIKISSKYLPAFRFVQKCPSKFVVVHSMTFSDDEDECLARELMNKMNPAILSKFRRCFKKNKERSKAQDIDKYVRFICF